MSILTRFLQIFYTRESINLMEVYENAQRKIREATKELQEIHQYMLSVTEDLKAVDRNLENGKATHRELCQKIKTFETKKVQSKGS